MKTGLSTNSLHDPFFLIQLDSLLENNIQPDFIILHHAGAVNRLRNYLRRFKKLIAEERLNAFSRLLKNGIHTGSESVQEVPYNQQRITGFFKTALLIKTGGINDPGTLKQIRQLAPALIFCNSGILQRKVLSLADVIFLNVHASRLPAYRGMNNVEWALWEGNEIWATIHRISREMDEGDILYQEKLELSNSFQSIAAARREVFRKSHALAGKALKLFLANKISFTPQSGKGRPLMQYYTMHPLLKKRLEEKLRRPENIIH